jgi:membrane protein YqaA with SNARE-associated domain
MNAVGIFAGRGDVILMMLIAGVLGGIIGWWLRSKRYQLQQWRFNRTMAKAAKE